MEYGKYAFTLCILFSLAKSTPPNESKQYRNDYVYNKKTDAFYKLHTESRYESGAKDFCEQEGAALMTATLHDIMQAHGMMKRYPDLSRYYWIASDGLAHESAEEQPLIDLNSNSNEYDHPYQSNDGCNVITTDGEVNTLPCYNSLPFICKVTANDAQYDNRCGVYATDYQYYREVGSCYKISNGVLTWEEAFVECQAEGAHLAVINSEAEHLIIKNLTNIVKPALHSQHSWYFIIGFRAIKPSRVFKTIFNQTLEEAGYSKWTYSEPNNLNDSEYCGSVFKSDGKLNDLNCIHKYAYICEKEVSS